MSDQTMTRPITDLVDTYFEMWRATDPAVREDLVAKSFTETGRHVDPHADVAGHDALAAMLVAVHNAYPGFSIGRTSGIDQHGDQARFAWEFVGADGTVLIAGIDIAELAPDGRLARVTGFWGDLPDL